MSGESEITTEEKAADVLRWILANDPSPTQMERWIQVVFEKAREALKYG